MKTPTLWKLLDGHKTQLASVALLLTGFAVAHDWIAQDTADLLLGLLTVWTGIAIGHAEVKRHQLTKSKPL